MELVRGGEESNKLGVAAESKQVGTPIKSTCDGQWAMGDEGTALALGPCLEGWWAIYFRCVNGKCDGSARRRTLEDGGRSSEGRSGCQVGAFNMDRGGQASRSGRAANVDCRPPSVDLQMSTCTPSIAWPACTAAASPALRSRLSAPVASVPASQREAWARRQRPASETDLLTSSAPINACSSELVGKALEARGFLSPDRLLRLALTPPLCSSNEGELPTASCVHVFDAASCPLQGQGGRRRVQIQAGDRRVGVGLMWPIRSSLIPKTSKMSSEPEPSDA